MRRFRMLNIIDDYSKGLIWIEIGLSTGAKHMTDLLEWIIKERGLVTSFKIHSRIRNYFFITL